MKRTVCVDFDGVLNEYKGYNERDLYSPKPFVENFLEKLSEDYEVVIFTSRVNSRVESWLERNGLAKYVSKVTSKKVPAIAYIDDRAIQFKGNYNEILNELEDFQPYWDRPINELGVMPETTGYTELADKLIERSKNFPEEVISQIDSMIHGLEELKKVVIVESFSQGKLEFKER